MAFPNAANDDILADLPFMMNSHMNNMAFPNQFFQFERWTLPSTLKELYLYSAHAFITNDAVNPAIEKLSEYPITDFTFTPFVQSKQGTDDYDVEVKEKSKITRRWKDVFEHHQVKGKAQTWSVNYYLYGMAALSIYQPFERSLICPMPECRQRFRLREIKYKWDSANLQFKGTCKGCQKAVTFKVKDRPLDDPKKINIMSFFPGDLDVNYAKTSGCYEVYWKIDDLTIKKVKDGDKLHLETTPKEIIDAIRLHVKKRQEARIKFREDNIFLMIRHSADFPEWPSVLGMPITIAALRGINHLNMMRRAQTAVLMEHILPFRFIFPQHQDNPTTLIDLGDWRKRMTGEILKWKRDPLYIMLSPIQLGYDQIGGQGKALLLYPEIEQQRESIIQAMNVPLEFVKGGLSYTGSSVSLRILENQMINHVGQVVRALKWITRRISEISKMEYVDVGLTKFKMADDIQAKGQLIQMHGAGQVSHRYLGDQLGFDAEAEIQQIAQEKLARAIADAMAQAKGMAYLTQLQTLLGQILPPDAMNTYPAIDPGIIDSYSQAMMLQKPDQQQAILEQMGQQNPALARGVQTKMQQDPMNAFNMFQQMAMNPQGAPAIMGQVQQQDPAMNMLIAALSKQFQMPLFGQGGGMGQDPNDPNAQGNDPTSTKGPGGTDMRPNPSQKPPRRENKTM